MSAKPTTLPDPPPWYATAIIYEVYPSTFYDSNGDDIGDIQGIIEKIPYFRYLGIDAIWLSACCENGGVDGGYDVVDYRNIDPKIGTVADIETLVQELGNCGIKLIVDLVVNHTSVDHPWFVESRANKYNDKRDWYFWREGRRGVNMQGRPVEGPPNNWRSSFEGSAWERDPATGEWYLHCFSASQPDLNWANEAVRQAVYADMRFWLDKGVAGFRMDVINMISKPAHLPDAPITDPAQPYQCPDRLYTNGPWVHNYLREMHREVLSKYPDVVAIGEIKELRQRFSGETVCTTDPDLVKQFTAPSSKELSMAYTYDLFCLDVGRDGKFSPRMVKWRDFKATIEKWSSLLSYFHLQNVPRGLTQAIWLESHDSARSVDRFGDGTSGSRKAVAKMLALLCCTLPGALFVFQGQELGMANMNKAVPISAYADVETKRMREDALKKRQALASKLPFRMNMERAMREFDGEIRLKARDHARTPMPWIPFTMEDPTAGFPRRYVDDADLLPVVVDAAFCNVHDQIGDKDSVLKFWSEVISWRKQNVFELALSPFKVIESTLGDDSVFAYMRNGAEFLVVLNLSNSEAVGFDMPTGLSGHWAFRYLYGTHPSGWNMADMVPHHIKLRAFEGAVFRG